MAEGRNKGGTIISEEVRGKAVRGVGNSAKVGGQIHW